MSHNFIKMIRHWGYDIPLSQYMQMQDY